MPENEMPEENERTNNHCRRCHQFITPGPPYLCEGHVGEALSRNINLDPNREPCNTHFLFDPDCDSCREDDDANASHLHATRTPCNQHRTHDDRCIHCELAENSHPNCCPHGIANDHFCAGCLSPTQSQPTFCNHQNAGIHDENCANCRRINADRTSNPSPAQPIEPAQRTCDFCGEPITGTGNQTVRVKHDDEIETWHIDCANNEAYTCGDCDDLIHADNISSAPNGDDYYCDSCFSEHCFRCHDCGESAWNDDEIYMENLDKGVCQSCISDYRECRWCEHWQSNDEAEGEYIRSRYGTHWICQDCIDDNRDSDLERCPESNNLIDVSDRDTYLYNEEGERISYSFAVEIANNSDRTDQSRMEHLLEIDELRRSTESAQPEERIRALDSGPQIRRSIDDLLNRLANKEQQKLLSARQRPVGANHDELYLGMELELVKTASIDNFFQTTECISRYGGPHKQRILSLGPHHQLSKELAPGFKMVTDGSIHPQGYEFLTPLIKRLRDWKPIENAVKTFKEFEWEVNDSCGLHFHFSQKQLTPDNPALIRNIFRIFFYIEPLIFACLPPERRNNDYCKPIAKFFSQEEIEKEVKLDYWYYAAFWKQRALRPMNPDGPHAFEVLPLFQRDPRNPEHIINESRPGYTCHFGDPAHKFDYQIMNASKEEHYYPGRYIGCNLHALFTKGTLEFRYFPMVLDFKYIFHWGNILKYILRYALAGKPLESVAELAKSHRNPKKLLTEVGQLFSLTDNQINFLKGEFNKWRKDPQEPKEKDPFPYQTYHAIN